MVNYITSESVTKGHPDKVCDIISDSILDEYLRRDKKAHVAVETMIFNDRVVVSGQVTSSSHVDIEKVVRKAIISCGYDSKLTGFDGATCHFDSYITEQSEEINQAVLATEEKELGAGDQGLMYGYATSETPAYLPTSLYYAHRLAEGLSLLRENNYLKYLYPDGKTQVTVAVDDDGNVLGIDSLVVSTQHSQEVTQEQLKLDIETLLIRKLIPEELLSAETKIYINPSGSFNIGGPVADTGLTGRKIIVDTYGGIIPHGGGAFSGKDPTKVDRSAAYMARYAAKQIVAAGLAKRCQVNVAYAIGMAEPIGISLETFGTEKVSKRIIEELIKQYFDFRPNEIIKKLNLQQPIYQETACYGHFKASPSKLPWEQLDDKLESFKNMF
ncbi:methionine adenosyltransferase [Vagococcus sp.]|uniref:methionine adenosyltransferase n=1 Tax=Vagococcus sp. TaxID=1933889 RepID=UPI003F958E67